MCILIYYDVPPKIRNIEVGKQKRYPLPGRAFSTFIVRVSAYDSSWPRPRKKAEIRANAAMLIISKKTLGSFLIRMVPREGLNAKVYP
jgi:hypothetical protein